ncbi:hypothetical protein [Glutamicibacter sp. NPDC087344]|uniref:hypothetical protein n=1 Tax=Glutamicibacter sp. NPDC087344 TaxID=3363994 RepID=UPI0037FFB206
MRLQQPIHVDKPVQSIKLRISAIDVPLSAAVLVTDIQLQSGEQASGVVPNPAEVGTTPTREQYRNGVINPGLKVVALSNAGKATPVTMQVRGQGPVKVGSYRFGPLNGQATADGVKHTASHGYGLVPIVTERQDLNLDTEITARAHLRLGWIERE